jgi:hypothetical protein
MLTGKNDHILVLIGITPLDKQKRQMNSFGVFYCHLQCMTACSRHG